MIKNVVNMTRIAQVLLMALVLSGCASTLETRVSTFRDESAVIGGGTIKVVPEESHLTDTLEFSHYRKKLEEKLVALGYMPVSDPVSQGNTGQGKTTLGEIPQGETPQDSTRHEGAQHSAQHDKTQHSNTQLSNTQQAGAQYLASLGYWVEEREVPEKGPRTSIGTSVGTVLGGRVGVGTGITLGGGRGTETEYYRVVTITIRAADPLPRDGKATGKASHLVEIRASSTGNCGDLLLVFDQMLNAIFSNFLRPSGSTETVKVPAGSKC